jgi:hypothetical protein
MAAGVLDESDSDLSDPSDALREGSDGDSAEFLDSPMAQAGDRHAKSDAAEGAQMQPEGGLPRPPVSGRRASFFFMQSEAEKKQGELAVYGGIDRAEAARVYNKVLEHHMRHWRQTCLSAKVKAALAAVDQAKQVAVDLGVREDSLLPRYPPLLLQRKRMGLSTGGLGSALIDIHRRQRNRDSVVAGSRSLNPNSLPLEYRPARPSSELASASLHAFLMFRRWEHKVVHLPSWRAAEKDRQRAMLSFTAEDIHTAMQQGPNQLARVAAGRYIDAVHSRGRPPPLLVGVAKPELLRKQLRPLVRRAMELAQTNRFLDVQEKRRTTKQRRRSIIEMTAEIRR